MDLTVKTPVLVSFQTNLSGLFESLTAINLFISFVASQRSSELNIQWIVRTIFATKTFFLCVML
jgi:hypothetical protein